MCVDCLCVQNLGYKLIARIHNSQQAFASVLSFVKADCKVRKEVEIVMSDV